MTKNKLKSYLYNAISLLEENNIFYDTDELCEELGMTREEYAVIMADDEI